MDMPVREDEGERREAAVKRGWNYREVVATDAESVEKLFDSIKETIYK